MVSVVELTSAALLAVRSVVMGGGFRLCRKFALASLHHVVRPQQQRRRDREPERAGRPEVDDQLERGGLLDREVGPLLAPVELWRESGRAAGNLGAGHA